MADFILALMNEVSITQPYEDLVNPLFFDQETITVLNLNRFKLKL